MNSVKYLFDPTTYDPSAEALVYIEVTLPILTFNLFISAIEESPLGIMVSH